MSMNEPKIKTEFTHEVAEHEILLSFNGDSDAVFFYEWWNAKGWELFRKWVERQ